MTHRVFFSHCPNDTIRTKGLFFGPQFRPPPFFDPSFSQNLSAFALCTYPIPWVCESAPPLIPWFKKKKKFKGSILLFWGLQIATNVWFFLARICKIANPKPLQIPFS